ncbi:MAG: hypothetical protein M9953_09940 [Thermomicrobiales bacterium]|nr:hypothetical protein [Thermomicrobiales bacterium]MCO5225649.1 hypothetical protein [Thermomicrobiales bacterium]MCO5229257.1 hypothetical protein [Thermomicrobiales bacterium]
MKFYAPMPRFVTGNDHHDLIRRLFRRSAAPGTQRIDLITTTKLRVSIVDCGKASSPIESEADTITHVLWQLDESVATITIGGDTWPIAPGDTAAVPTGDEWYLSPNQLTLQIARRSHELALPVAPHHGTESYSGHNRGTSYDLPASLALQRWKLTEPCTISTEDDLRPVPNVSSSGYSVAGELVPPSSRTSRADELPFYLSRHAAPDVVLVGLYNDLALQHHSEVELMPQGEVRVVRGDGPITLVPNGLSYALIIRT